MKSFYRIALAASTGAFLAVTVAQAQINLAAINTIYAENFDSLISSGSANWVDNTTLPGWYASGYTNPISASTGSNSTPDLYSFGAPTGNGERALGSVTGANGPLLIFGARLSNATGSTINALTITYDGEQWRNGGTTTPDRLNFQYRLFALSEIGSINAVNSGLSQWIDANPLDFGSIVSAGTQSSFVGATLNITGTLNGLALANGRDVWIRWEDSNVGGATGNNDDGLAIDNFRVSAIPEPSTYGLLLAALVAMVAGVRRWAALSHPLR